VVYVMLLLAFFDWVFFGWVLSGTASLSVSRMVRELEFGSFSSLSTID
jgi:hypothetical protein